MRDAEDAVLVFKDAVHDCTALSELSWKHILDYKLITQALRAALTRSNSQPVP